MFDLTSSKLLLLGIIALLVVGPKDLPGLLRTVGRYVGMLKRQAAEFRSQFDEAMRESELSDLKKQVEDFGREAESAVKEAEQSFQKEVDNVQVEANKTLSELDAAVEREANAVNSALASEAKPAALPDGAAPIAIPAAPGSDAVGQSAQDAKSEPSPTTETGSPSIPERARA